MKQMIPYNGKEYGLEFNLNVMEKIQEEYGTLEAWGSMTDGKSGEINIKALIFGIREMINEWIDIRNEENGTNDPMLTAKQVGRMVTALGFNRVAEKMNQTVIDSVEAPAKNA